ncbi:hypothetical protein MTO96_003421 [Rhipicephalus appendiculatus]
MTRPARLARSFPASAIVVHGRARKRKRPILGDVLPCLGQARARRRSEALSPVQRVGPSIARRRATAARLLILDQQPQPVRPHRSAFHLGTPAGMSLHQHAFRRPTVVPVHLRCLLLAPWLNVSRMQKRVASIASSPR